MTDDPLYSDSGSIDHGKLEHMLVTVVGDIVTARMGDVMSEVRDIKTALTGNGLGAQAGIIAQVREHEERLGGLEVRLDRLTNRGIGAGVGIGLGAGGIGAFLANLIGG